MAFLRITALHKSFGIRLTRPLGEIHAAPELIEFLTAPPARPGENLISLQMVTASSFIDFDLSYMPSIPYDLQRRVAPFRDQRWLLDVVIRLAGREFDQSRLHYLSAPMSPDHQGAVTGLQALIKRWDDLAPEFAKVARRFELQGRAALKQGHEVIATDSSLPRRSWPAAALAAVWSART